MKGEKIKLAWTPTNPMVAERGPSETLEFKDDDGNLQHYHHYKNDDRYEILVDHPLASFLLSQQGNDYQLLEPKSIKIKERAGMGIYKTRTVMRRDPNKPKSLPKSGRKANSK